MTSVTFRWDRQQKCLMRYHFRKNTHEIAAVTSRNISLRQIVACTQKHTHRLVMEYIKAGDDDDSDDVDDDFW